MVCDRGMSACQPLVQSGTSSRLSPCLPPFPFPLLLLHSTAPSPLAAFLPIPLRMPPYLPLCARAHTQSGPSQVLPHQNEGLHRHPVVGVALVGLPIDGGVDAAELPKAQHTLGAGSVSCIENGGRGGGGRY